jgi:hypothetical protein
MPANDPVPVENRANYRRSKWEHVPIEVYGATLKRLTLEWLPHLTEAQLKLTLFLISQTLGHGKRQGSYTINQIIGGVNNKQAGGKWTEGTGLSERAVYRAMKELVRLGLITKKTGHDAGWIFEVNTDWNPTGTNVTHDGNIATIHPGSQPKRSADKARAAGFPTAESAENLAIDEANGTAKLAETYCKIGSHPNRDLFQIDTEPLHSEVVAQPSPSRSSIPVKNQEDFTGEEKAPLSPKTPSLPAGHASMAERPVTGDTLERAWRQAWKEGLASGDILPGSVPTPWGPTEKKMMMELAGKWGAVGQGRFADFLAYVVKNWKTLMRAKFGWMIDRDRPPPSLPSVHFLAKRKFLSPILDAYSDQETIHWTGTLRGTEIEIAHAMRSGMSREAAILYIAKGQALTIDRRERDSNILEAKRLYEMAELAKDRYRREGAAQERYRNKPAFMRDRHPLPEPTDAPMPSWTPQSIEWGSMREGDEA